MARPRALSKDKKSQREEEELGGKGRDKSRESREPRRWRSFVIHRVAIALARRRTGFEHVRQESHEARKTHPATSITHRFLLSARGATNVHGTCISGVSSLKNTF